MSGIRDLIPGSVIDATMFNPCGYSMNGMKADVSVWDQRRWGGGGGGGGGAAAELSLLVVAWCLPGNLLDHPHHPGAGVLLRQL